MAQTHKVGHCATKVVKEKGSVSVTYHDTEVVYFDAKNIILNSGSWKTSTTKLRINQASNQYGLGLQVYQKAGIWYVDFKGKTHEFFDGMALDR